MARLRPDGRREHAKRYMKPHAKPTAPSCRGLKTGERMKKLSIILMLVFVLSGTLYANILKPKIFSLEDTKTKILGISLNMDKSDVEKILRKPNKVKKQYEDAFGADVLNYYYDSTEIRLEPGENDQYYVASIYTKKLNAVGPRGIKIGDKSDNVLLKFPLDRMATLEKLDDSQVKCLYGKEDSGNQGYAEYDLKGNLQAIRYAYQYYSLCMDVQNDRIFSLYLGAHNN